LEKQQLFREKDMEENDKPITKEEIMTAYKVLEYAREDAKRSGFKHKKGIFNDAHYYLQEQVSYWEEFGYPDYQD